MDDSFDVAALLRSLPLSVLARLAGKLRAEARRLGLVQITGAGEIDIPITLTPEILHPEVASRRASDASLLLSSVVKVARYVLAGEPRSLFAPLCPLELEALTRWRDAEDVTIARVDWLVDREGNHKAVELNPNIPGCGAWADMAAAAWLAVMGELGGLPGSEVSDLISANGSNLEELRRSLLAHSDCPGGSPSIAILHRPGDSMLYELEALQRHLEVNGHESFLATPADVELGSGGVTVAKRRAEILYRHIYPRFIPRGSALERVAVGRGKSKLQNPINGQLRVKGPLGKLSELAEIDPEAAGLSPEEVDAIERVVPWTGTLVDGPAAGPHGERVSSLVSFAEANAEQLVLKPSGGHGGLGVHIGREVEKAEWRRLISRALADPEGGWVVQSFVETARRNHLVVHVDGSPRWEEVVVDACSFTATGDRGVPGGGVNRFGRSRVVNVGAGGGIAPSIDIAVAERLGRALDVAS